MRTVAVIPARAGSKGVPDKNIKPFAGKPLLAYAIEAAQKCPEIDTVCLSSDSDHYLRIGEKYGARTIKRDQALADDNAPIKPVVESTISALAAQGENYDAVILLYPIYPIRFAEDLSNIINEFKARGAEGSILGAKEPDTHPYLCLQADPDGAITHFVNEDFDHYYRRQDYPQYLELTHWACVVSVRDFPSLNNQLISKKTTAYRIPKNIPIVDIDTPLDFEFGEFLMRKIQAGSSIPGQS